MSNKYITVLINVSGISQSITKLINLKNYARIIKNYVGFYDRKYILRTDTVLDIGLMG